MSRRGFTLIEMLVATGLMSLLLALVYSSLHRALVLRSAGQAPAEHDRLARAVVRQFEQIVTRVSTPPTDAPANAWEQEAPELMSRAVRLTAKPQAGGQPMPVDCGILGTANTLVVFHDPAQCAEPEPLRPRCGQLTLLAMNTSGTLSLPTRVAGQIDWQTLGGERPQSAGLLWVDAATQPAGVAGPLLVVKPRFRPCDDRVTQAKFRYFDGRLWYDSWDTCQRRKNPLAVELQLTVGSVDAAHHYRTVVTLPHSSIQATP